MVLIDKHPGKDDGNNNNNNNNNLVDFRGNPVDKSKTGGWLAAGLILGTELSERICVMGISMNLVTYLIGDLHLSSAKSANIVTNFMGTLNLLGLLGGFVADAKLGRFLTVAISASIAALGVTLLTLATTLPGMRPPPSVEADGRQLALLYTALYTIALGGGGIKSNVSGFGSDQFDTSSPKEKKAMIYFFNRFYFSISLGSLFAVTVLVYVQDNVGRGYGYGISAATMAVAVAVLLLGTSLYRFRRARGSPLTAVWRVLRNAWTRRRLDFDHPPRSEKLRCLDKAAIIVDDGERKLNPASTVTEVEEVKMVIMLVPIWSTCILFWTVYSQMNTFTIEQATLMDRRLGKFEIPAGSFSFFLIATILLFTSLNGRVFVPLARKFTHTEQGISSLQRVGIGLVFSVLGMVAAALVEKRRRRGGFEKITAFWLVPQFFLVGAGEAFAYVGQLEFFIREAPERMKSMSTGLFLSTLSMGYFVSSLLVSVVDKATGGEWLESDLNEGRLDNFYWMLAVLGVLNFCVFLGFARRHHYKVQNCVVDDEIGGGGDEELKQHHHQDDDVIVDDDEKNVGA